MSRFIAFVLLCVSPFLSLVYSRADDADSRPGYAIVATVETLNDSDWRGVVEALAERRQQEYEVVQLTWSDNLTKEMSALRPKYACFVLQPEEATQARLAEIWKITRNLDDDPYGDVLWGIITGYDAATARRMTQTQDVVVERAVAATSIPLDYFKTGVAYDEGQKNRRKVKEEGAQAVVLNDAPDDTTKAIADALDNAQLFVTSGHASERNWSIGYSYKNGFFVAQDGKLIGKPSNGPAFEINAKGSKVHLASGNCLWGNIDKRDCMALAMMNHANVDAFVGYVVPTWFGYMGWGVQDYYIEQPGRFTVAEAFFANNQALLYLLEHSNGLSAQTVQGLKYDRDVVVLYGDPAWNNALAVQDSGWKQTLTCENSENGKKIWTLTLEPMRGEKSFALLDSNGSERGGRPIVQFFRELVKDPKVLQGEEFNPLVLENFILIPVNQKLPVDKPTVIKIESNS